MNVVNLLYHPDVKRLANITKAYYEEYWGDVISREARWSEKPEAQWRNELLKESGAYDKVLIVDVDEVITREDLGLLNNVDPIASAEVVDYADEGFSLPHREHRPTILVSPKDNFYAERCLHGVIKPAPVIVHHLHYIVPQELRKKYHREQDYRNSEQLLSGERKQVGVPEDVYRMQILFREAMNGR